MKMRNGGNPWVYAVLFALIIAGIGISLMIAAGIVEVFK